MVCQKLNFLSFADKKQSRRSARMTLGAFFNDIFYIAKVQLWASASVDADICAGRCGHLRRSMRTSAPVDADVCVGRCAPCKLRKTLRLLRILNYFCNFANIYIIMYNQTKQEYQ